MLQTNNTGMCSQYLSHTGPVPAGSAHSSGSRLLHREPSDAVPGLHALPRSKPLRFRHSGILNGADLVEPAFCALPRSE